MSSFPFLVEGPLVILIDLKLFMLLFLDFIRMRSTVVFIVQLDSGIRSFSLQNVLLAYDLKGINSIVIRYIISESVFPCVFLFYLLVFIVTKYIFKLLFGLVWSQLQLRKIRSFLRVGKCP